MRADCFREQDAVPAQENHRANFQDRWSCPAIYHGVTRGVARFPDSSTAPSVFALESALHTDIRSFRFVCQVEMVWMKYETC